MLLYVATLTKTSMPEIGIGLSSLEAYEAASVLFATLAYPDFVADDSAMTLRHAVLCHLYLRARAFGDDVWQHTPWPIKPLYWLCEPRFVGQVDRELRRRMRDRMAAARMAIPFLQEAGGLHVRLPSGIERLSINKMAELVTKDVGQAEATNVERRVWKPSTPVVHIAAAIALMLDAGERQGHPLMMWSFFESADLIRQAVDLSNDLASLLGTTRRFRLPPEQLIRLRLG